MVAKRNLWLAIYTLVMQNIVLVLEKKIISIKNTVKIQTMLIKIEILLEMVLSFILIETIFAFMNFDLIFVHFHNDVYFNFIINKKSTNLEGKSFNIFFLPIYSLNHHFFHFSYNITLSTIFLFLFLSYFLPC